MTEQAEVLRRRWYGSPIPDTHLQIITHLQQNGPTCAHDLEASLGKRERDRRAVRHAMREMLEKGVVYVNYDGDVSLSPDKTDKAVLIELFERLYLRKGNDGCELFWHDPDQVPRPPKEYENDNVFRVRVSRNGYAHDGGNIGKRTVLFFFDKDGLLEMITVNNEDNLRD